MDSFVHGWRALWWGRVWGPVLALTLGWSIGTGLALRALVPSIPQSISSYCSPGPLRPLIAAPWDALRLHLEAALAVPLGFYVSGMEFALLAFIVAFIPAARLQQGTARRILSAPLVGLLAAALMFAGWSFTVQQAVRSGALPQIACSN